MSFLGRTPWYDPRSNAATTYPIAESCFNGRLTAWSINELRIVTDFGRALEVYGDIILLSGPNLSFFANATTTINLNGLDTGNLVAANTFYNAYLSNSAASYAPLELRLSTRNPVRAGDGSLYMQTTGNGRNWRYVGSCVTNAGAQFLDTPQNRNVASHFNRRALPLFVCPNYADDAADTTYNFAAAAVWTPVAATASVSWISLGEDAVTIRAQLAGGALASQAGVGLLRESGAVVAGVRVPSVTAGAPLAVERSFLEARGAYSASLVGLNGSGGNWSIFADFAAAGSVEDVPATFLSGVVFG